MRHSIYQVTAFEHVAPYTLRVAFNDRTTQVIDFYPVLIGQLYGPLRDLEVFNQVRLDPDIQTLVWPNDADFDPATLHNWPTLIGEFQTMAERWTTDEQRRPLNGNS